MIDAPVDQPLESPRPYRQSGWSCDVATWLSPSASPECRFVLLFKGARPHRDESSRLNWPFWDGARVAPQLRFDIPCRL